MEFFYIFLLNLLAVLTETVLLYFKSYNISRLIQTLIDPNYFARWQAAKFWVCFLSSQFLLVNPVNPICEIGGLRFNMNRMSALCHHVIRIYHVRVILHFEQYYFVLLRLVTRHIAINISHIILERQTVNIASESQIISAKSSKIILLLRFLTGENWGLRFPF